MQEFVDNMDLVHNMEHKEEEDMVVDMVVDMEEEDMVSVYSMVCSM